jgi:hypothetical protein
MIEAMDRKLVRTLNANARKSYREMAKELGTSTTAVIRGIKKLEASGAISGYIPVVDPNAFGFDLTVVVSLRINQGNPASDRPRPPCGPRPRRHGGVGFARGGPFPRARGAERLSQEDQRLQVRGQDRHPYRPQHHQERPPHGGLTTLAETFEASVPPSAAKAPRSAEDNDFY